MEVRGLSGERKEVGEGWVGGWVGEERGTTGAMTYRQTRDEVAPGPGPGLAREVPPPRKSRRPPEVEVDEESGRNLRWMDQ